MKSKLPWMETAEAKIKSPLRYHTADQAVGACPQCERLDGYGGDDRLVVYEEGNYFCRQCKRVHRRFSWWWTDQPMSKERIAEKDVARKERIKQAYSQMHSCQDWVGYSQALLKDDKLMFLWFEQGVSEESIIKWGLGYCNETPTDDEKRSSLTIPVFYQTKLYDIRHRIIGADNGSRYRSHMPNLSPVYFNLDNLKTGAVVYFVEGEKKAIILEQEGFSPCIAYPGINFVQYTAALIKREGNKDQEFVFLLDPGTETKIEEIATYLSREGWQCSIVYPIIKPDDFVLEYGLTTMQCMIGQRRKI